MELLGRGGVVVMVLVVNVVVGGEGWCLLAFCFGGSELVVAVLSWVARARPCLPCDHRPVGVDSSSNSRPGEGVTRVRGA